MLPGPLVMGSSNVTLYAQWAANFEPAHFRQQQRQCRRDDGGPDAEDRSDSEPDSLRLFAGRLYLHGVVVDGEWSRGVRRPGVVHHGVGQHRSLRGLEELGKSHHGFLGPGERRHGSTRRTSRSR